MVARNMTEAERDTAAAEYAFGLLTEQEALALEEVMAEDPEVERTVAAWMVNTGALGDLVTPMMPPPGLRRQILGRNAGDGWFRLPDLSDVVRIAVPIAALVLMAGLGFALYSWAPKLGRSTPDTYAAQVVEQNGTSVLLADLALDQKTLDIRPLQEGQGVVIPLTHVRTLWVKAPQKRIVRLGTIESDGAASFVWPEDLPPAGADLTVSVERRGAAPRKPSRHVEGRAVLALAQGS